MRVKNPAHSSVVRNNAKDMKICFKMLRSTQSISTCLGIIPSEN